MSIKKSYAVLGLGRYGSSVAKELARCGADILAVDRDIELVNNLTGEVPLCKCADITDPAVIKQLGISNFDVVIIAAGGSLEVSVLATMLCKEAGVKTVIAKCSSEMHRKILSKVGADKVVLPESESGTRLAKNLLSSGFVDIMELDNNVSIIELDILPDWIGKSLIQLDLRKKYDINVIALKKDGNISVSINPSEPLTEGTQLVVIADTSNLTNLK